MRRAAMVAFRWLPRPVRRLVVRAISPSFTVGAVAVLRRPGGDVLFVEQAHTGGWALPGGLLARGESALAAVVRELQEEVGIRLSPLAMPVPYAAVAPRARRTDIVFVHDVTDDAVPGGTDSAEVRRAAWFPLSALPEVTGPTVDILHAVRLL